jgi:hypothetical protein
VGRRGESELASRARLHLTPDALLGGSSPLPPASHFCFLEVHAQTTHSPFSKPPRSAFMHMADRRHAPGGASVARALLLIAIIVPTLGRVRLADPVLLATIDGASIGFAANSGFGNAAAISWDGSTIVIGVPYTSTNSSALVVLSRTGGQEWDVTQVINADFGAGIFGAIVAMSDDGLTLATTGECCEPIAVIPYLYSRADGHSNFSLLGPVASPPGFRTGTFVSPTLGASAEQGVLVSAVTYSYIYTWTGPGCSNGTHRIVGENVTSLTYSSMSADGMWTAAGDCAAASFAGQVNVGFCESPEQGSQCSVVQQLSAPDSLTNCLGNRVVMTGDSLAIIAAAAPYADRPVSVLGFWRNSTSEMYNLVGTLIGDNFPMPNDNFVSAAVSRGMSSAGDGTYTVVVQLVKRQTRFPCFLSVRPDSVL